MSTSTIPDVLPGVSSPSEAAQFLGVSVGHLANLRSRGTGPAYARSGGRIRYLNGDLIEYLEAGRVETLDSQTA